MATKAYVWDWPVRLCHLALILLIPSLWYTGTEGLLDWHFPLAYSLLAVVLFRLVWGFCGSRYARFSSWQLRPKAVLAELKQQFAKQNTTHFATESLTHSQTNNGHSPLGSYSVVIMFSLIILQLLSGLVSTDDFMYDGPLRAYLPQLLVDFLAPIHSWNINLLLAWIGVHLLAVIYYQIFTAKQLIKAMITGYKNPN